MAAATDRSSRRRAPPLPQQQQQHPLSDSDGGYADDFHAEASAANDDAEDHFPLRYGDALATSISSTMPIPTGAGQLARAVAQAAINARAVARDKRRRAKREEQRMMQRLREAGLAGEEADPATTARGVPRATPLFGDDLDAASFNLAAAQQTAVAASLAAAALSAGVAAAPATVAPAPFPAPTTRRGGGGGRSPRRGRGERSHKDLLVHNIHSDVEFGSGSDADDAFSTATGAAAPKVDAEVEQINALSKRIDEYKEAAVATAVPSGGGHGNLAHADPSSEAETEEQKEASDAAEPSALPSMSEEEEEMADLHARDGDAAAMEAALAAGVSSKLHSLGSGRAGASKSRNAAALMSVTTAGLTSTIAHSVRGRARQKGSSGSGSKPTSSNAASAFLAPSGPTRNAKRRPRRGAGSNANAAAATSMRDDSSAASLSSLLHGSGPAHAPGGRYQLSEEERKISAYYATIQNAATKVSASLDALLPEVGGAAAAAGLATQDPEALTALWTKQGLSPEEIRIRLQHRLAAGAGSSNAEASPPPNEHDAYRNTFSKLTSLLNSLSTASLTAVGRGGVDLARNNLNATEQSFREFQEQQEEANALARRQKEEEQAAAAAAAAAQGVDVGAGAVDAKSGSDSEIDSADSDSEDEEALLAATLRGESTTRRSWQFKKDRKKQRHQRRASVSMLDVVVPGAASDATAAAAAAAPVASPPAVTLANPLASPVVAGSVSTPSSFGADVLASVGGFAGALQLSSSAGLASPSSTGSVSAAAASSSVDNSAASIYRDLHSFFLGKRRSELIDSKRLHLLETQAALVEEAGESSRAVVQQVMSFKLQKTDQVLSNYHRHLLSQAGELGKMMLQPPAPAVEWGADGDSDAAKASAAAALAAKQRAAGGSSNADEATQRLKLELVVAMLQARVAEQDELLASIGVADSASAPNIDSKSAVQYTYDANPHLSRSFELKSARLLGIVSSLSQQLKARQEVRHRLQDEVDRARDSIARLLQFEDQAAMDAKMAAQASAKDAEIAARHAAATAEIRKQTAAAEAKFQEVARKNHAMTLTLTSVESELGALHALREAEGAKITAMRSKHKKDCIQILRGVVPKHLRSLMSTAQKEVVHYQPGSGAGAKDGSSSAPGPIGSSIDDDPELLRPQLVLQDEEVRKDLELREAMTLADWEAAEAREAARKEAERNPPPNPPTAEELAAAEAARAEAEAAAALEAERALTPFSSCRLRLERLYAEVGSQEMVYIPWQEELYLTLQPQVARLSEEIGELQARRKIKAQQRREYEEKAVALAAQESARLAEEAARKQRELEEADADSVDSDPEGDDGEHSELQHDSATLAALAAAQGGKIIKAKVGPKIYPKRVPKGKSYLANGAQSPRKGGSKSRRSSTGLPLEGEDESDEIASARFLSMGNNEYVKSSIGSFKLSKTLSNSALQQHILALKAETATLSQSITNLMAKWTELAETDARVTKIESTQIAPTRKRITVVKAHLARIEAAIEAKVKWMAQREEAQRAREAEMKELDEKLRAAERAHQENEIARREAERLAKQAELQAGGDQIPEPSSPPPASSPHHEPAGSPKMSPLKLASRSRRPSIHGSPSFGASASTSEGFAAPTVTSSASRERSRRPSVSLTPNLAPTAISGARPVSQHGRHSRTPSSMGRSGAGGKHRRSLKKEEMAELALNAAAAAAAAASPSSPHRSPTALQVVVPPAEDAESQVIMLVHAPEAAAAAGTPAATAAAAAATEEESAQLAAQNAKLLEETAALERELAQLELEQEALEFEQQQAASEVASHQPSPLASGDMETGEPVVPMQWGSSLSSRIAAPPAIKVANARSTPLAKGTRTPTTGRSSDKNSKAASAAQSRRPSIPAAPVPLTPLQQSSQLFVAPSLSDPPEGDAATVAAAAAAVEYENSKQMLGAYEQLKLDMARWKEEARLKAEKANMPLPAVKAHTTLETIKAEQDTMTESDGASVADPASSSLASLSKPSGPLPANAPRWAPGPAIVALALPPEVHAPAPVVPALLPESKTAGAASTKNAPSKGSAVAATASSSPPGAAAGKKKVVRTVNIGLPGSVPPAASAGAAVLSPNKISVAPKNTKASGAPAPSESGEEDEELASTQVASASPISVHSLHPVPARVIDMSLPSLPSESESMLNSGSGPVRSPQKVLRNVDHNAAVSAASNVIAAGLDAAMADSSTTGADQSNATEVHGSQRRRAAASGSRIGAAERRLQDLPPFSAHAMSIPALAASDVATSARRSIAHPGAPSPIKAATKGRRRSGEAGASNSAELAAQDIAAPAATATVAELLAFASTKPLAPRHPGLTSKRSSLVSAGQVELPVDGAQQLTAADAATTASTANDTDTAAPPMDLAGSVEAALAITTSHRLKVQSIDPVQSLPHEASLSASARRRSMETELDSSDAHGQGPSASKRSSLEAAREMALALGAPLGAALSVTGSKPVMGGGLNLASLLPHQHAGAGAGVQQHPYQQHPTHASAKQAPVLFVSAASKPIQTKPPALLSKSLLRSGSQPLALAASVTEPAESIAAEKGAEEATAQPSSVSEETFVVSSQTDAAPLSLRSPMRHATSSSSLAHGPREPVHMSTTNLGALLDRQRGRPVVIDSTELTASASSPLVGSASANASPPPLIAAEEDGADAVIPMGTPSFSSPLPKSFQPKVDLRKKHDEHAATATVAGEDSNHALARSQSAVSVLSPMLPQRSAPSIPSSTRHAAADQSSFAAFISSPSAASLRASATLESGSHGSPRQRSVSPPPHRRVSQLSSAGASASSVESSVHVPLTSSASSGRLVPVSSTLLSSFVSARDRADAAEHAALLHSFSRILSPQELHTVAEQAPRLQLQGIVTAASVDHHASASSSASTTRRAHVSPERRLLSTARPSLTGIVDTAAASTSGSSSARGAAAGAGRKKSASTAAGTAASHLNTMLRVQASSVVSQSGTRNAAPAATAAAAAEPALHADITAYLASLHASPPTKPVSAAPSTVITSPRTQRHRK